MTKKQAIYTVIWTLILAAALDIGIFVVMGMLLLYAPVDFDTVNPTSYFVVMHYRFDWIQYLIEAAFIFLLITSIMVLRRRMSKRGKSKSE